MTIIASAEGGVEIEETARTNPEAILRLPIDPLLGLQDHNVRRAAFFLGLPAELRPAFASVLRGLYDAFMGADADLAEINPLVVTEAGELLALDAKIVLDDSALFRHADLEAMRDLNEEEPSEIAAREAGINFIKLDGSIGCMVNGAGLAMTTMDLVKLAGGEPANFLDIGGGAKADRVAAAFRIILDDPNVKAILVNIFGGITRGDEVARGIVEARSLLERDVPMVVRIVGTNAEEARPILARGEPDHRRLLDDAAAKAVAAAAGQRRHEHPGRHARPACWSRASPAARASSTRAPCSSTARRSSPASRPARAARWRWTGACRSSTPWPMRSPRPAPTPPASSSRRLRARRHARGGRCRRGAGDLHHRGHAGPRHAARLPRAEGARRAADRAELPGRHHGRRGQGGDHPRLHPSARARSAW